MLTYFFKDFLFLLSPVCQHFADGFQERDMSKNNKNTMPNSKTCFAHPLLKDVHFQVRWARATDGGENRVAIFSVDEVHTPTGIRMATHNSLSILQVIPRDEDVDTRVIEIGSMSKDFEDMKGRRKIYSHTWYPGRNDTPEARDAHRRFADDCAQAVKNFIEEKNQDEDRRRSRRGEVSHNPLADQLRSLTRANRGRETTTTNSD